VIAKEGTQVYESLTFTLNPRNCGFWQFIKLLHIIIKLSILFLNLQVIQSYLDLHTRLYKITS